MELDDAYQNAAYIPGGDDYPDRWAAKAAAFRAKARSDLNLSYGARPREVFDLFGPAGPPQGLIVFVHGGYWLKFDKSVWSHLAAGPVARGWAVAMPSYDLCPNVGIDGITAQIARAVDAAASHVPGPIRLVGHSAGGHLVARMVCPDSRLTCADRIQQVMPISAVSDLEPLMRTSMNADLHIDADLARRESPIHHGRPAVPVTVWVGAGERPAFLDQAQGLAEAWGCRHVIEPGRHHFDVIEGLEDPESGLLAELLK